MNGIRTGLLVVAGTLSLAARSIASASYTVTDLGIAVPYDGMALNDAGQVVGAYYPGSGSTPHAFVWSKGQYADLGSLATGFNGAKAFGINNSGVAVGATDIGHFNGRAFVYANGMMNDLGLPVNVLAGA